jgi:hypothetical protein
MHYKIYKENLLICVISVFQFDILRNYDLIFNC